MVSDFGRTRYCKKCGKEIVRKGDCITWYEGMEICKCDEQEVQKGEGK
jgi:hypothetical protein